VPSFAKPTFEFSYDVEAEKQALRHYRDNQPGRAIPKKRKDRLLIASWNIANLGLQKRQPQDYQLLAEIISWFDIVAIQEVNDDLRGLRAIQAQLPPHWRVLFSDPSGNNERMAFIYDRVKVHREEMVGEIGIPVKDHRYIKLPDNTHEFRGFDRNPYVAALKSGDFRFVLVNVHLYFGKDNKADRQRRSLEAYATARWADLRTKDKDTYSRDIIALGDFNLPKVEPGDPVYSALRRRGLHRPPHSTKIASNISNDKDYDQILFVPRESQADFTDLIGVFDFDGAIFEEMWNDASRTEVQFRSWLRYYISDHRPLWAQFRTRP